MPAREIIDGVLELVAGLETRGTRALDVSCRNGEVMTALAARGFEVRGTRFERGLPPIEGMPIDEGVDLTRGLPLSRRELRPGRAHGGDRAPGESSRGP